jgi:hypothetical protein
MSRLYQSLDGPHFDYTLEETVCITGEAFRGPLPNFDEPFVACIGGAQTFGRFVHTPFTQLLQNELGIPVANLGLGGAGPRYALRPDVLAILNRARLVVVQYFSGRSASCSLFDNSAGGRNSGRFLPTNQHMSYERFFKEMEARGEPELMQRIVEETRADYAHTMREIARAIRPPKLALWISRRPPAYEPQWVERYGWMNFFPQLLDHTVTAASAPSFDAYVECVSKRGLPQKLWPATAAIDGAILGDDGHLYNEYYPTPEMHLDAAAQLSPVCRKLLSTG